MPRLHSQTLDHQPSDAPAPHRHPQGQLLWVSSGLLTVLTEDSRWTLPPGFLAWMPPQALHGAQYLTPTRGLNFYVDEAWATAGFPAQWKVLLTTPLLTALLQALHDEAHCRAHEAYQAVLADLVCQASAQPLCIPMPADPRLRPLCEHLLAHPDDATDLDHWAQRLHMSRRTLSRRFQLETGMGFAQWRQQVRLTLALERLVAGAPVTTVALDMGYESPSAFITRFKQRMGLPPKAWLARASSGG